MQEIFFKPAGIEEQRIHIMNNDYWEQYDKQKVNATYKDRPRQATYFDNRAKKLDACSEFGNDCQWEG